MKILMVAIPNHHFFQWVNQLKDSGHEIYWFDITDGGSKVERISWVYQIKGWKQRFKFPFRQGIKSKMPRLYKMIQKIRERDVKVVFEKVIEDIKPDIIHCFEMKLAGMPILDVLEKKDNIKFIYSSWGSDMYAYQELGLSKNEVESFFKRVDFLVTDCKRDYKIACENGFKNTFLGVFPGNGGIYFEKGFIKETADRNIILIKGYEDGVGKAIKVIESLELVSSDLLQDLKIVVYSADLKVKKRIEESSFLNSLDIRILGRNKFISNEELLKIMGKSIIHIGNSISDGMPNVLLESMGMGAFPIQSNPGNVTEEVVKNGINGFIIKQPLDSLAIAKLIENAIKNIELRTSAQEYNTNFIAENYNRKDLEKSIVQLYEKVLFNKN
ncbi:MAG: glycosyltransferase [Flavobacterium nitrogenifigens]|uniref:Glycosyltransferase involved in cell wall bisynthesis n=1 Tax=Flavobacterium nitrogenifigens TaxID=1617283 RepID=A0A521EDW6_9FLAO|nr:glycosyltransferase [Flavobacterium nitrogenifigens]KAF2325946.1 glycosyltransferase family 4 protein [Flavobacterium nitrogenifigens]MDQ8013041.1 glycosyltransferase [Flavobacterium nitrogenifigens]SMO82117.1 Glycosyltransferase involved in cell wall bisynthesis [Flavobacterium nitrogenifigens]